MKKNLIYIVLVALLAGVAYWMTGKDTGNSIDAKPLTNFAIKDTASIYKLFIVDQNGKNITLSRGDDNFWYLNNEHKVVQHAIKILLETFATAGVQSTVPESNKENILRAMTSTQRKVIIYGKNDEWIKTWYLGSPTQSSQGTYMILETPEEGLSSDPYIVEKRGFRGYLTSRFHTIEKDWRWKGVFYYPKLNIKDVKVIRPNNPDLGFEVKVNNMSKNDIVLLDQFGNELKGDKTKMHIFLTNFQEKYVETFNPPGLTDHEEDSVAARTPDYQIIVTDTENKVIQLDLQYMNRTRKVMTADGFDNMTDIDRMYGVFNNETIQIQRINYDPLLIDRSILMQ